MPDPHRSLPGPASATDEPQRRDTIHLEGSHHP